MHETERILLVYAMVCRYYQALKKGAISGAIVTEWLLLVQIFKLSPERSALPCRYFTFGITNNEHLKFVNIPLDPSSTVMQLLQ